MKIFGWFFILIICLGFFSASSLSSIPQKIPMVVSGQAYMNGEPADAGVEITAKVNDDEIDRAVTEDDGRFAFAFQNLNEGDKIEFYVDGIYADGVNETLYYHGSSFNRLTLEVEKSYRNYYIICGILLAIIGYVFWRKSKK
jgi:hypothetical protein